MVWSVLLRVIARKTPSEFFDSQSEASIQWFLLPLATKWNTSCEKVWKTVPGNGVFSCVPFCFWSLLRRLERCASWNTLNSLLEIATEYPGPVASAASGLSFLHSMYTPHPMATRDIETKITAKKMGFLANPVRFFDSSLSIAPNTSPSLKRVTNDKSLDAFNWI